MRADSENLVEIANSLVIGDGSAPNCRGWGGQAGFASLGGNLSSDSSPCQLGQPGDATLAAAVVAAALADHGGWTETLALLPGSPALAAGLPAHCPERDQRGALRRSPCDAGAVEAVPVPAPAPLASGLVAAATLRLLRGRARARC
jgi:hypothetical protein